MSYISCSALDVANLLAERLAKKRSLNSVDLSPSSSSVDTLQPPLKKASVEVPSHFDQVEVKRGETDFFASIDAAKREGADADERWEDEEESFEGGGGGGRGAGGGGGGEVDSMLPDFDEEPADFWAERHAHAVEKNLTERKPADGGKFDGMDLDPPRPPLPPPSRPSELPAPRKGLLLSSSFQPPKPKSGSGPGATFQPRSSKGGGTASNSNQQSSSRLPSASYDLPSL